MSSERIGKLAVEIEGDASGLSQGFKEAEKATGGFADKFHHFATGAADSLDEFIDKSKKSFGKRSAFGEAVEFFTRGAQVFAVAEGAKVLSEMSDKLADFGDGKKSVGEVFSQMARGLPIVGDLAKTADNVFTFLDGSAARMSDLNDELERNDRMDKVFGVLESGSRAHKSAFAEDSLENTLLGIDAKRIDRQKADVAAKALLLPTDKEIKERISAMGTLAAISQSSYLRWADPNRANLFQELASKQIEGERAGAAGALGKDAAQANADADREREHAIRDHNYKIEDMERELALHRRNIDLSAFRATAKDAVSIWRNTYDQMLSDFSASRQQMIDSIQHDNSLSATEKAHFLAMVDNGQAFNTMANARKEDFFRANFLGNLGAGMKLEGIGGDLLGKIGGMQSLLGAGGGESQAFKQGMYRLQTEMFGQGIRATLYEMATDKNLDPSLKAGIPGLRSSLDSLMKSALSPDMISRATAGAFLPTMLAPASITSGNNFVGYGDALRQHMDAQAMDPKSDESRRLQQQMVDLLKKISDLIAQQNQSGASQPLIDGSQYNY